MGLEPEVQGMECGGAKQSKPASNVSGIVTKFAKVCKLRSIGVFASENVNQNNQQNLYLSGGGHVASSVGEETSSSDATEEADFDAEKVDPQPVEVQDKGIECLNLEMSKLLDTVKALKLAYVQLQEAHIPYNPDKIRAADELVVSHLEALGRIKRSYKEKQLKDINSISARSALLLSEIQAQEKFLEKLKSQVEVKKCKAAKLHRELQDLELRNTKMGEELREQERERMLSSLPSFEEVAKAVAKAIHDFAKPLIALMKVSGWDLDTAVNVIQDSVSFAQRSHKKYAFEAYIARRMFHEFEAQSYDVRRVMKFDDPIDALIEDHRSSFAQYCRAKYLLAVHPSMEASFFGNKDHRTLVTNGVHPHTPFYREFVKMAKWVWILQGIASSGEPNADIFGVKHGDEFSDTYMECVEELKNESFLSNEEQKILKVEFMVMPGFILGQKVIKSRVYLSQMRS